jgi:hypothetical protein
MHCPKKRTHSKFNFVLVANKANSTSIVQHIFSPDQFDQFGHGPACAARDSPNLILILQFF